MPTSPPLRWSDLRGRPVGVWGLGTEGRASTRRLLAEGIDPVLVDDRPSAPGVLATGEGGLERLLACEVVVKTPGISRHREDVAALEAAGVAVVGGLGLWLEGVDPARVVAVTGTKGKSTTVSVLGHLLAGMGWRCVVGGNLGTPPFDPDVDGDPDLWVVEVSSYQATDLWSSPPVVAVTSLHPDHLDWHGGEERYYADKLSLCSRPGGRVAVVNGTDERLRDRAHLLGPQPRWVVPVGDPEPWVRRLGLRGAHSRLDALVAQACLQELGVAQAADTAALERLAVGFEPLPSRLRTVAVVDGVELVDDSLSTNVLPTLAALAVFDDRPVALLAGGHDRHIDYTPLAEALVARTRPTLVVTLPANGWRIRDAVVAALDRVGVAAGGTAVELATAGDLTAAVPVAFAWARPGRGVVLLSPAAPSFGPYRDYRERAEDFARAVGTLGDGRT